MTPVAHWRALICVLVAIAMTFASIASAWAVSVNVGRVFPQPQMAASQETSMPDCERMGHMSKASGPTFKTDTPNGKSKSCADNFCMAKCFKMFGGLQADETIVTIAGLPALLPLQRPAIWFDQPPFAPPRS
jgi:hypothetical protein